MEDVRRKVTARLAKGSNNKPHEEWLKEWGCVPQGKLVNRIAFLEHLSRGIALTLLGPRGQNQDQWINCTRRREGEDEDLAQEASTLHDHAVNLRLPSCPTVRDSSGGVQRIIC